MHMLYGIEELANERVEELRKRGDEMRFLDSLPRRESFVRRGVRAFAHLLLRYAEAPDVRMPAPVMPRKARQF